MCWRSGCSASSEPKHGGVILPPLHLPTSETPVDPVQFLFGAALVIVLLVLAGYYARRQIQTLQFLRQSDDPSGDRLYGRGMAWRRLVCCGLMVVFAGFLIGALFLQDRASDLAAQAEAAPAEGGEVATNPEQQDFIRFYSIYWIIALLVLLGIIVLAAADMWAIRRFGLRQHRKIQDERRAMIERQVARLRRQRNGRAGLN